MPVLQKRAMFLESWRNWHLDDVIASSALRISFSEHTTKEDIDQFCYYLQDSLGKLKKQR